MTEADWMAWDDPLPMLYYLRERVSDRKLRLFGCACIRRVRNKLIDERNKRLVEIAERCADGLGNENDLAEAMEAFNEYLARPEPNEEVARSAGEIEMEAVRNACLTVVNLESSYDCALFAAH